MGLLDDGLRQALEGKFGSKLEEATRATIQLKDAFTKGVSALERGIDLLERVDGKLDTVITELKKR